MMINSEFDQMGWEKMAKYFAGEMEVNEKLKFEGQIKASEKLINILNQVKSDWNKMENYSNNQQFDSENAWQKLFGKLEKEGLINEPKNIIKKYKFGILLKVAAIIIFGILFASVVYYYLPEKDNTNWNVADTYKSTGIKEIKLPDGSVVILNAASKLYYPEQFSDKERIVEFEGDAFFNIQKNPDKPFIIKARSAEIRVLGTSFNVNTNLDNNNVEVLVTTGKVRLSAIRNPQETLLLEPGFIGKLSKNKLSSQVNTDKNYLSWKTRYFNFTEGIKLGEAIKILNRAYNVQIRCKDKNVCEKVLNSTFNNDSLEKILELICNTYSLKTEKIDNEILLYN